MEVKKLKTVRFDVLVKESGQPEQITLWTKPEQNRDFMKAVNAGRVVTVSQQNVGTKKDYGIIGFSPEKNAAFFVFPKTLEPDEGTKVIGINYERIAAQPAKRSAKPSQHLPGIQRGKVRPVAAQRKRVGKSGSTAKRPKGVKRSNDT